MNEEIPAFQPENTSLQSAGQRLRSARETMGLSLKEAAQKTQQSPDLLRALEDMRTDMFSSTVLRMHARTYAGALGLPQEDIAQAFAPVKSQLNSAQMPGVQMSASSDLAQRLSFPVAGLAAVLGLCVLIVVLWPRSTSAVAAAPVSSKVEWATRSAVDPLHQQIEIAGPELRLVALRPSFVEIRGSDGTVFRNRDMRAGEEYFPRVGAGWTVTVQDAGAFEWRLGELSLGSLGNAETPAYAVPVDAAMARGLSMASEAMAEAERTAQTRR